MKEPRINTTTQYEASQSQRTFRQLYAAPASTPSQKGFRTPAAKATLEVDINSELSRQRRQEVSIGKIKPEPSEHSSSQQLQQQLSSESNKSLTSQEEDHVNDTITTKKENHHQNNHTAAPPQLQQTSGEKPQNQTPFERQYKEYLNRVLQAQMSTSKLTESRKAKLLKSVPSFRVQRKLLNPKSQNQAAPAALMTPSRRNQQITTMQQQATNLTGFKRLRRLTPSNDDLLALEVVQQNNQRALPSQHNNPLATTAYKHTYKFKTPKQGGYKRRKLIDWVNTQQRRHELTHQKSNTSSELSRREYEAPQTHLDQTPSQKQQLVECDKQLFKSHFKGSTFQNKNNLDRSKSVILSGQSMKCLSQNDPSQKAVQVGSHARQQLCNEHISAFMGSHHSLGGSDSNQTASIAE